MKDLTTLNAQEIDAVASQKTALAQFVDSAFALQKKMMTEFSLRGGELREVAASLDAYGHAYRQYGTAQIVSDYFKEFGIPFTEATPDPMIEHSESIRKAALGTIGVLRNLGCDSEDINFIADDLKKHGEAGRILGNADGIMLVLKIY